MTGPGEPLLVATDVVKHFPVRAGVLGRAVSAVHAVDGVSLTVRKGETLGLVGESGCGKSTLGRVLVRLLDPTSGSVTFEGEELVGRSRRSIRPLRQRQNFSFNYDPEANNGIGRITVRLDDHEHTMDLTPAQRAAGATMDRFGIMNIRRGGKYVDIYFDDLTYTARPPSDANEKSRHEQSVVQYPYPPKGRKH